MLYLIILLKRYVHGIFAAGLAIAPTQEKKKSRSVINFIEKSSILDACFLSENAPASLLGAGQTLREKCPFGVFLLRIFPHSE